MNEQLIANTFLYITNAIVFGTLTFFLWQFFRGYGREYVKYWLFSLSSLCLSQLALAAKAATVLSPVTSIQQVSFQALYLGSYFCFVTFFIVGLVSAQKRAKFKRKKVLYTSFGAIGFGVGFSMICAFAEGHNFDRFFMRETIPSFMYGLVYLGASFFLFRTPPDHFSSRIMTVLTAMLGLRYLLFSLISTFAIAEVWFEQAMRFVQFFDVGTHAVIGFSMLIWMQGAERSAAAIARSKASYLGKHDPLTGSLNREQVLEKMPEHMAEATQRGTSLGIFLLDIKRFKFVNDTYGLKTGDYVLGVIAKRLKDSLFKPVIVGRLSGDSFVFIYEFTKQEQVPRTVQHLHQLIAQPYSHDGQEISLQCSIGYSFFPEHTDNAESLLQFANLALFHAESRNEPSKQFSHDMKVQGRHLLEMETSIKVGMRKDEFELYFQPQLNLLTNKLEGVEALIRWNHPEKGLLTPDKFLPDVDALALNSEFDNYVLEKACKTIKHWYETYNRRVAIAVNITAVEFQDPKLISKIQKLLIKYDVPPKYLELEITENVVMTDLASAMNTIVVLQNMGIKVSIDDFGTGYSSLAYLRKLPIDKIKIDRSFVQEMAENDSDFTIVKSMIKLSHGLGKRVLAEGVETKTQLDILRNLDCDAVQGYYISKPVNEAALVKYFSKKSPT
ncbi:putative bifunctional diguanylate cyclase/phosphodiesterase [Thalassotalea euphylliae]|uniref:putative bifunctional diguanylate cyclase/phosphodiesterase n=1 Tax=Thalassotalea euphylliae TaxID=1655234 RepID=UPI00363B1057